MPAPELEKKEEPNSVKLIFDYSKTEKKAFVYHDNTKLDQPDHIELKDQEHITIYNDKWQSCGKIFIYKKSVPSCLSRTPAECRLNAWTIHHEGTYKVEITGIKNSLNSIVPVLSKSGHIIKADAKRVVMKNAESTGTYSLFKWTESPELVEKGDPIQIALNAELCICSENDTHNSNHLIMNKIAIKKDEIVTQLDLKNVKQLKALPFIKCIQDGVFQIELMTNVILTITHTPSIILDSNEACIMVGVSITCPEFMHSEHNGVLAGGSMDSNGIVNLHDFSYLNETH